jgi:hypothetical protein
MPLVAYKPSELESLAIGGVNTAQKKWYMRLPVKCTVAGVYELCSLNYLVKWDSGGDLNEGVRGFGCTLKLNSLPAQICLKSVQVRKVVTRMWIPRGSKETNYNFLIEYIVSWMLQGYPLHLNVTLIV